VELVLGRKFLGIDSARSDRVMRVLMQMIKLDIAALRNAYDGGSAG
jgi:hypothetical protein